MPLFDSSQQNILFTSMENLSLDFQKERIENFVSSKLNLNFQQTNDFLPDPDIQSFRSINISMLTKKREDVIKIEQRIPNFYIFKENDNYYISGLVDYIKNNSPNASNSTFINKIRFHKEIRNKILSLKGHNLEALSAQILSEKYKRTSFATRGSGDQGIDVISWYELLSLESWILNDKAGSSIDKVFILGSSKHTDSNSLINPAQIRELVGGWMIQRSEAGKWKDSGIKTLSPVQLLLISTYRLSDESWELCEKLGVRVWSMPEIIYNICLYSPDNIFSPPQFNQFNSNEFDKWWGIADVNRKLV